MESNPLKQIKFAFYTSILLIFALLTGFLMASESDGIANVGAMILLYPAYIMLSTWLAWKSYNERPEISWILIILMILSTIALLLLINVN